MLEAARQRVIERSVALRGSIESNLDRIVQFWLVTIGLASAVRVAASPIRGPVSGIDLFAPYALLIAAPVVSLFLALRWFADGANHPQPSLRLARLGRWTAVSQRQARRHPLYGADGIMVSLLVGILLNVPVRAAEYFMAMPALSGNVPAWLATLRLAMTVDVVVMTSLYTIAFVAALRRVPIFPRLLAGLWALDLAMQFATARLVAAESGLPPSVAEALHGLIEGNVWKVLISMALWAPYLMLSKRVNVTYRHRLPA